MPASGNPYGSTREALDDVEVAPRVAPQQVGVGRRLGRETRLRADRAEQVDARPEPAGRQRMAGPEVVVGRPRAEDEQHRPSRYPRRVYHPGMPVDLLFILIIILVLVLMWRGPKNLPKLGEALGRGSRKRARGEQGPGRDPGSRRRGRPPTAPAEPSPWPPPHPLRPRAPPAAPDEQRPA